METKRKQCSYTYFRQNRLNTKTLARDHDSHYIMIRGIEGLYLNIIKAIYLNNKISEKGIKKTTPFTIA